LVHFSKEVKVMKGMLHNFFFLHFFLFHVQHSKLRPLSPLTFHYVGRCPGLNPGQLQRLYWQPDTLTFQLDLNYLELIYNKKPFTGRGSYPFLSHCEFGHDMSDRLSTFRNRQFIYHNWLFVNVYGY